ncbi:immunoglobulin domain-containing protein [Cellulomonas sp. Y8]|uniref:immunoglobulin domain-containing protein n=1 Tax=Cellulomonas sp. Y8 TaxID=2591145 RepID=UPI003D74FC47
MRTTTRRWPAAVALALAAVLAAPAGAAGAASRLLPAITTVVEGGSVTLDASEEVIGGGVAPTSVQWSVSTDGGGTWAEVPGARDLALTLTDVALAMDGWCYQVRVRQFPAWLDVGPTTLRVTPAVPTVTRHPDDLTVAVGGTATFTAAYGGTAAPTTTRWDRSAGPDGPWSEIAGATSATLAVGPVTEEMSGTRYRARFGNAAGTVTTDHATLTVPTAPPTVTQHPSDAEATEYAAVTFAAEYTSSVPVTARWQVSTDGEDWALADAPQGGTLTLDPVTLAMDGWRYRLRLDSAAGTRWTSPARLTVRVARPVVTAHPVPQAVAEGGSVTFSGAYGGTDAPTSTQWQVSSDGGATFPYVADGTASTLVLDDVTAAMDGWLYRVRFTNAAGPAWSEPAALTVHARPVVTEHPADVSVTEGGSATFTVGVAGGAGTTLQWQESVDGWATSAPVPGATGASLVVDDVPLALDGRQYRVRVASPGGTVLSDPATLTVTPARPTVTLHPTDQRTTEGGSVTFDAAYGGTDAPTTVQWQVSTDGGATFPYVAGGTALPLVLERVTLAMDGWQYRVRFRNAGGTAWSAPATLTVAVAPPVVTLHPADQTQDEGGTATFTAAHGGTDAPTTVQWHASDDGTPFVPVPGATAPTLVLDDLSIDQDGRAYRARFTNAAGSAWSDPATLTVTHPLPVITEQPADQSTVEGGAVTFAAAYTSTTDTLERWQVSTDGGPWQLVPGGTSATLTLDPVTLDMDGRQYRLRLDNARGARWTTPATLTVRAAEPVVTEQPADQVVAVGESATFRAAYGGTDAPTTVQWEVSTDGGLTFPDVSGGTAVPLVLDAVTPELDGRLYRARFTNAAGSAWSVPARLTVLREVPALTLRVAPRVVLVDALPGGAG